MGSVPLYTDILVELMKRANAALDAVVSKSENAKTEIVDFREAVVAEFIAETGRLIESLPRSREYGAAITLRDYGYRNRDDIARRIRLGRYREVEEAFARRGPQ